MPKYSIVYADPPWSFRNKNSGGYLNSGSANKYKTMSYKTIGNLRVREIIADDAILFLWWVAAMPDEALYVARRWGFEELRTMTGFVWVKETASGKPHFGMGWHTRQGTENCLIATRGNGVPRLSLSVRAVVNAPVTEHSRKPPVVRDRIVALCGDLPRVELFARERVAGWAMFGDQLQTVLLEPGLVRLTC